MTLETSGNRLSKRIGRSLLCACVLALILGCVDSEPGSSVQRVVLITIDTLRADHVGCYGYPRATTKFIDRLAAEGVLFERALAPMSTTSPSHASLFTALYPIQHRVLQNGHVLADRYVTFPEILRDGGFTTAAAVSTDAHFGPGNIFQGFGFHDEPVLSPQVGYRPADRTIDTAIDWLSRRRPDERFFLWVHLFDPHTPMQPPAEHLLHFQIESAESRASLTGFFENEHRIDVSFFDDDVQMLRLMDHYDAEVRFVDSQIERLYERLSQLGLQSDTLWIITSDHGEGLGNHGWLVHGKFIYNEQIRIPLIFHFMSDEPSARRVPKLVELTDVMPTVLELVGADAHEPSPLWQGTSFVPLLRPDGRTFPDKLAFAQRREYPPDHKPLDIFRGGLDYEPGETYGIQDHSFKYVYRTEGNDEFFVLRDDPYESRNLIGEGLVQENRFRTFLLDRLARFREQTDRDAEMVDEDTLRRLESLGYF
jgi:arylsulfatase A-like enzyme